MFSAIDSFLVALVIIIGSAIANWLQKRKQNAGDHESSPPGSARPGAPPMKRPAPRQAQPVSWEEQLRRLLEGDEPAEPPPPPMVVVERKTVPAPPPRPVKARPLVEATPLPPARSLVTLTESSTAYQRAGKLDEKVGTHLGQIGEMSGAATAYQKASQLDVSVAAHLRKVTEGHVALTSVVRRKVESPEITQVVSLFRSPRTARQAIIASLILGPPRSLEEPATGF